MPRERKWSFEGITCDYVDEGHDSYYEITIAIMALKEQQVLGLMQASNLNFLVFVMTKVSMRES